MKPVILYGNGSVAEAIYFLLTHDSSYEVRGFTVDRDFINDDEFAGLPIVPFEQVTETYPPDRFDMYIAVGHTRVNQIRAERYRQAKSMGYGFISYVSRHALTWPNLIMGEHCKVGPRSSINPFACLGNDVRIGTGCNVGHHSVLMDHCSLAANVTIAGNATIGPYCVIGAGATIRDRVTVAKGCVIGAGAVILSDTKENEVYLGRPAELLPIASERLSLG